MASLAEAIKSRTLKAVTQPSASNSTQSTPAANPVGHVKFDWPEVLGNKPDPRSRINVARFVEAKGHRLYRDLFSGDVMIVSPHFDASGRPVLDELGKQVTISKRLSDDHESLLWGESNDLGLRASQEHIHQSLVYMANCNPINPVTDWLDYCEGKWDGESRIENLFTYCLGAEDTELNRAIGRAFMLTLVARARNPGCQLFGFPVLEDSRGGAGKGEFIKALVGLKFHMSGLPLDADPKRVIEDTKGIWLVEASELVGLKGQKGFEHVLECVTRGVDVASEKYARNTSSVPRRFAIIGTTNSSDYLRADGGGLRRFWPITVGLNGFRFDGEMLSIEDREQLFGEASALVRRGEVHNIPPELWTAEADARALRMATEPLDDILAEAVPEEPHGVYVSNNTIRTVVTLYRGDYDKLARNGTVRSAMRRLGFEPIASNGKRGYQRGTDANYKGDLVPAPSGSLDGPAKLKFEKRI